MARVLVVDDSEPVRTIAGRMLAEVGHEVLLAGDAVAALEILCASSVDIVLSDVRMPGMSGAALMVAAHGLRPAVPVIAMSGDDPITVARDLFDAGWEADVPIISKPFVMTDLVAVIDAALRDARRV